MSSNRTGSTAWVAAAALALVLANGATAGEQEKASREIVKTLTYSGGGVSIDNRFGGIVVRTHAVAAVAVKATIHAQAATRAEAEALLEEVRVAMEAGADGVRIRTDYPQKKARRNVGYGVDYEVTIPATAPLRVRNRFGSIDVAGVRANADIGNAHGSVAFRDGAGEQTIENAFGSISVDGNAGNVTVHDANGSVTVKNVAGEASIRNRFGSITASGIRKALTIHGANGSVSATDIGGPLKVTNSFGSVTATKIHASVDIVNANGKIDARDVKGDAKLETSFGAITFANIGGDVTSNSSNSRVSGDNVAGTAAIRNSFGSVELRGAGTTSIVNHNGTTTASDIRGAAEVDARFGLVKLENVRGNLTVTNGNGGVNASQIGGSATVTTSFAPVFLQQVGGAIDVTNQNGSVSVSVAGAPGGCREVSIDTAFGSLELDLPDNADYDVDARTSFGRITSAHPLLVSGTDGNRLSGKLGKGGCRATLTNSNGSITIK